MLKTRKGVAALVALVVLALGGATVTDASAARHAKKGASAKKHVKRHRTTRHAAASTDTTGSETTGTESPGAGETPGSESGTASDGPGGHADEPGNPNADHQFDGVE
jgi:hypothetical protein